MDGPRSLWIRHRPTSQSIVCGPMQGWSFTPLLTIQSISGSDRGQTPSDHRGVCEIFYLNQFSDNYKIDENALRKIIKNHVCQIETKIKLSIYYKSRKISNLIMKNNLSENRISHGDRSHVIYEFTCSLGECMSTKNSYIGMTKCTLRERLSKHKQRGSIYNHLFTKHGCQLETNDLLDNTKILYSCKSGENIFTYEALHIKKLKPTLNTISNGFSCLKLDMC